MDSKIQRIEKLRNAIETLKNEFVGLDSILDEIELSIRPWYVTPELIKRPQIISLWGMTGTGKTSVVKRLIELLDINSKALFFDCGEDSEERSIFKKLEDYFGDSEDDESKEEKKRGMVYVFDEFQYARTISESGEECNKSGLRPIWSIIDSGIVNSTSLCWDVKRYTSYVEDLEGFSKDYPNIKLDNTFVTDSGDVKTLLEELGMLYFDRGIPGYTSPLHKRDILNSDDSESYSPIQLIDSSNCLRVLKTKLPSGIFREVLKDLRSAKTISELVSILKKYEPIVTKPRIIDCSDALVFILGNLDEAYYESRDINPDIDADIFYETTSKVTVTDIKDALKRRFRPEQISRFGNNIIKYPCLNSENFRQIIDLEVGRICSEFRNNFGINVFVNSDFRELLYFEGVYPVQGVRPVFTTIGTILTPLLSKILVYLEERENKSEYNIEIGLGGDTNFKKPEIKAIINYTDHTKESVVIKLNLGNERNPESRKTRVINSVHEAGHAIVMSWLTGKLPIQIVSVSTDHGGFCLTFDKEKQNEIKSRQDIANSICISLAGYEAEKLIFGERPGMLLCGSSSDITEAWEEFSDVAYKGGYFEPFEYSNIENESSHDGIPRGFKDSELLSNIRREFDKLRDTTIKILTENKHLIVNVARNLSEQGEMSSEEFKKLISENLTGTLTLERLEEALKENDYGWYLEKLESI